MNVNTGKMKIVQGSGTVNLTNENTKFDIVNGYHDGSTTLTSLPLEVLTSGSVVPSDMVNSFTAWVNGIKVEGNVLSRSENSISKITTNNGYKVYIDTGLYMPNLIDQKHPYVSANNAVLSDSLHILAENIAKNSTILGVTGTYTSDATATAKDIYLGHIAYSNGVRIVGELCASKPINVSIERVPSSEDNNKSFFVYWNNPIKGPYSGVTITLSEFKPDPASNTVLYKGTGDSILPGERNNILIKDKGISASNTYYLSVFGFCDGLPNSEPTNITLTLKE